MSGHCHDQDIVLNRIPYFQLILLNNKPLLTSVNGQKKFPLLEKQMVILSPREERLQVSTSGCSNTRNMKYGSDHLGKVTCPVFKIISRLKLFPLHEHYPAMGWLWFTACD